MERICPCGYVFKKPVKFCPECGMAYEQAIISDVVNKSNDNLIKEFDKKEELKILLHPFLVPHTHGLRTFFIGNEGSAKNEYIQKTAQFLYSLGKTKQPDYKWVSFSNLPKQFEENVLYVIGDIQNAIDHLFNLEDFSSEGAHEQLVYQRKLDELLVAPQSIYIILEGTKTEYKGFINLNAKIPFIFHTKIEFEDLTNKEIYDAFKSELSEYYKKYADNNYETKFIDYLDRNRRYFPFNNIELAKYLVSESTESGELSLPKERYTTQSLENLFSSIIGMDNVKSKLTELNSYLKVRKELEAKGATLPPFNLHMMFLGNPGVGKTSVARLVAKILFDLGYIREDKLIEVCSKDLVSAFSGQTGIKTNRVIARAMGGVLFVDEAYALSNSCGQAGAEAIAILIKAMEDYKGDIVMMFAGYSQEMDEFVKSNSGIESRISYNFNFADYTTDELLAIFMLKLKKTGLTITDDGTTAVRNILKFVAGRRNFGNGRFVDKLLQATLTQHATLGLTGDDLLVLRKESVPEISSVMRSIK